MDCRKAGAAQASSSAGETRAATQRASFFLMTWRPPHRTEATAGIFVRLLALAEHLADDALEIRAWAGASSSAAASDLQRLFDFFNRLLD